MAINRLFLAAVAVFLFAWTGSDACEVKQDQGVVRGSNCEHVDVFYSKVWTLVNDDVLFAMGDNLLDVRGTIVCLRPKNATIDMVSRCDANLPFLGNIVGVNAAEVTAHARDLKGAKP